MTNVAVIILFTFNAT